MKNFSLSNFKKWMNTKKTDSSEETLIGETVKPKISFRKLMEKIETEQDSYDLAKDFKKKSGKIIEKDGENIMIEVDSGNFVIKKKYIKKIK